VLKAKHYQPYLEVIEPLLRAQRDVIMKYFGRVEHEHKGDRTVVTHIDKQIEQNIRDVLGYKFPEIGFNGEEFGITGNKDRYWLVDPIDSTENFIRGIDGIGTMMALVERDKPELAVIYNPVADVFYWAVDGEGAWRNGERLRIIDRKPEASFVETDCARDMKLHMAVLESLRKVHINVLKIHGCATRAILLSEGKIDGTIRWEGGAKDWDYVPSSLLAVEAGMIFTSLKEDNGYFDKSFAILSPSLHKALQGLLEDMKRTEFVE
jgi:fructose-1,6-bisphosphatase/inositol monophosphatase family enzyme